LLLGDDMVAIIVLELMHVVETVAVVAGVNKLGRG
jgi:hypothetical protein